MLTEHLLGRSWERDSASCWETRRCYGRILCLLRRTVTAGAVYPQVSVDRGSLRVVVCMLKVFEPRPARFHSASHSRIFEIWCAQPRLGIPKRSPTSSD